MGYVPDWSRQDHKKTSGGKTPEGIKRGGSLFHGNQSPARTERSKAFLADGGDVDEAALKAEGLEASKGESVGLWDRLKAGNIDEVGSEANMRFGSGRGNTERQVKAAQSEISTMKSDMVPPEPAETPRMTAAEFQRTDKDTTPVPMPEATPKPRVARSRSASYDQSPAETQRLESKVSKPTMTAADFQATDKDRTPVPVPESAKKSSGGSFMDTSPLGLARSVMKAGASVGSWLRGSRASETSEERQARLNAAGTPSGGRAGTSLMDRGRNYANGGMVKGKKSKC